ncbi:MAG TPA: MMPL family transporter, partial [Polyangiaceae bacterium]|nr:MMPL family transporter [Polyangiaceae bacterium]
MKSGLPAVLIRLGRLQVSRPWFVIAVVLATLLPAGWLASRLDLKTSFTELLPDSKPSVIEMRRTEGRLASNATLTIVAESSDVAALKAFVDAITPRLSSLDKALVSSVDTGTRDAEAFFERNQALYLDLDQLEDFHERFLEAYDAKVQQTAGLDLGLDSDATRDDALSSLNAELDKQANQARRAQPGVDGYYIGDAGGQLAAILVHTSLGSFDPRANELRRRVEALIAELGPRHFALDMRIGFTGDLITAAEAQDAVIHDLVYVGKCGVGLVLGVVFLYFLSFRAIVGMGLSILVGCVWAFGAARLSVGYLNIATGFLVSIIAGNGINFGIVYMARYIEARGEGQLEVAEAVRVAHEETWAGTLAAAAAALVAYGSLSITDFRGSRHFGIIGGVGMVLCWLATYLVLPAWLVASERLRPFQPAQAGWRKRLRGAYGVPVAWISERAPRALTALAGITGAAALLLAVRFLVHDPMDYSLGSIRNDHGSPTSSGTLSSRVDKIVGRLGQDGRAIVTDRIDEVEPLVHELRRRRDAAPPRRLPFQKAVSIFDLLPKEQGPKLALLRDIVDRLERAKRRGLVSDADYDQLEARLPKPLTALTPADLPERLARPFTEKDGTRGRIVYIVPSDGRSVYDVHYLMEWADSFREVKLPSGDIVRGTGEPVILSDMILNVKSDAPKAIALSLVGTLLVIVFAFRARKSAWLCAFSLLLGFSWLIAFLVLRGIKLNFLNFIALPI